ncbi:MAG TPA: TonB-dependent receptor [Bacteroidales bacterium]|nr:TonB-dependent receptor [Bacteroidales bacterium]
MKLAYSIAICLFFSVTALSQTQKHTISGYVKEAGSGEFLTGVNIYLPVAKIGTVTNTYGFYSLTISSADSAEVIFSYVGFVPVKVRLKPDRNIELNIDLVPGTMLKEVTVEANAREKQSESVRMSTTKLQVEQVKNIPSLLGEKDVLKVLQLLPGVQKGMEGSSGIYVRGGGPDQNLIILDDAIVYNASHLFGFFSLFNGDALKSVELTKGGFPARYGGRLSSVLDMNMKEGNKEEWHGEGGIGLISSRMTVEGPIKKNKSSILLSGRRTYADLIMRPILKSMNSDNTGYYFYDFNAKVNYDFGRKNKLYLSGYFGKDKFYLKNKDSYMDETAGFLWKNSTGTLRWNHLFTEKLFSNTSLVYSNYTFSIFDKYIVEAEQKNYYASYFSGITDLTFKHDLDFIPSPNHLIKAGVISISHQFKPYAYIELDEYQKIDTKNSKSTDGLESGIYAEDTWSPFQSLKINAGLRFSSFFSENRRYGFPEPRFSFAWRLKENLAIKGSYSEMNQYIHLISNTGINLPTDLWVPTTDRVKPQHSRQAAAGFVKDGIGKHNISFSFEGYYKLMQNVIAYKEGATFLSLGDPGSSTGMNWENNITVGKAWSYGTEFLLEKKFGKLTGWIGYTLAWTQMQFDSLNFGRKFYARYDRRHDISIVGVYRISDRITISGSWVYGTGNAVTLPTSEYQALYHIGNLYPPARNPLNTWRPMNVSDLSEKNNYRMAAYHRLDAGIQFHKKKRLWERTWEFSVYNAYNRQNPFYLYQDNVIRENKEYGILKQVSLFPVIPSFTYSLKF